MLKRFFFTLFLLTVINNSYAQELRGTWIARDALTSKETLAQAMDSLAANNFNTVYINAWSRGYPLWQSSVFNNEAGVKTDPLYSSRDIIAEAVAEGHRVGLHVEAWFEYGFVGGWSGNMPAGEKGPIFKKHPDWVARKSDGTEIDGSNFYWMAHARKDAQDFLIALAAELTRNYDIDGIELDRIRYSSTEYGYDNYTDSLYKTENSGSAPPKSYNDAGWIKWRADKLNQFAARIYDTLKNINPNINVSNAPSLYGTSYTSYNQYCQDWVWWVNNKKIDNVQVQSYLSTPASFGTVIDYMGALISDKTKAFPCFAVNPSGTPFDPAVAAQFVTVTRDKGYKGNSIWYHKDLISFFPYFKSTIYKNKTYPPFSPADWRELYQVVKITDSLNVKRTGNWITSSIMGFTGPSPKGDYSDSVSVSYTFNVPAKGYYEVYVYGVNSVDRYNKAEYTVNASGGAKTVYVDQTGGDFRRWYKIGDYQLDAGRNVVLKVTNKGALTGQYLSADAVMISLNRRLSPDAVTSVKRENDKKKDMNLNFDLKSYPNPFNNQAKVVFNLKNLDSYKINLYNIIGQKVYSAIRIPEQTGRQEISFETKNLSSGVYILNISQVDKQESIKLVLSK
jgi:uncharacterized lipoprotein YddW (UPF0748 family)